MNIKEITMKGTARQEPRTGHNGKRRPECPLVGKDGNVFAVIGRVRAALRAEAMEEEAREFMDRAFKAESYDAVLRLCMEYVEVC